MTIHQRAACVLACINAQERDQEIATATHRVRGDQPADGWLDLGPYAFQDVRWWLGFVTHTADRQEPDDEELVEHDWIPGWTTYYLIAAADGFHLVTVECDWLEGRYREHCRCQPVTKLSQQRWLLALVESAYVPCLQAAGI